MVIDLLTEADIQTRASRRRRRTPGLFKGPSSPFFDIDILIGVQDFDRSVQTLIVAGFVSSRAASGLRPAGHTTCGNTRPTCASRSPPAPADRQIPHPGRMPILNPGACAALP